MVQNNQQGPVKDLLQTFGNGNTESAGCVGGTNALEEVDTKFHVKDPRLRALLDPETFSLESETDSSSEEDLKQKSNSKKRKAKHLKTSFPKPVRPRHSYYVPQDYRMTCTQT